MIEVARLLRSEINDVRALHNQLLNGSLLALDNLFPGNVEEVFRAHVIDWDRSMQSSYALLSALADNLRSGSQLAMVEDQSLAQEF
jgi:uncharacterized protein YukE